MTNNYIQGITYWKFKN